MIRNSTTPRTLFLVVLVALALGGATVTATGMLTTTSHGPTVDATPSDPNDADATHAVTMPLGSDAGVAGQPFDDLVVDYSLAQPTADVSNVGTVDIERIGIDRGDDAVGTRIDDTASVTEVSAFADGKALRLGLAGNLTLQSGDEVVVVLQGVQNPQNAGNASVEITVNSQSAATSANATVRYEQNDATVTFENRTTDGDTVTVQSVNLSEGGFVVIQNTSGAVPGEVRGASTYLEPGRHEDVTVTLDEPLTGNETLVAQAILDTNGDRIPDYESTGGEKDGVYRNVDDNVIGSDEAELTYDPDATTTTTTTTQSTTESTTQSTTESTTQSTTESTTQSTTESTMTRTTDEPDDGGSSVVANYEDASGDVDTASLGTAVSDWAGGAITTDQLIDVIEAWAASP